MHHMNRCPVSVVLHFDASSITICNGNLTVADKNRADDNFQPSAMSMVRSKSVEFSPPIRLEVIHKAPNTIKKGADYYFHRVTLNSSYVSTRMLLRALYSTDRSKITV